MIAFKRNGRSASSEIRTEVPEHGGPPGWYRVATACCVLAALNTGHAASIAMRAAIGGTSHARIAVATLGATVLLARATMLAARQQARAGLYIALAYAIHAAGGLLVYGELPPVNLWMVAAMLALIGARGSRDTSTALVAQGAGESRDRTP